MQLISKIKLISLFAVAFINPAIAQSEISGVWQGDLSLAEDQKVTVEFVIENKDGNLSATVNTPHSGIIKNVKANSVVLDGNTLTIKVGNLSGVYSGSMDGGAVTGTWTQAGTPMQLNLQRFDKPVITPADYARVAGVYTDQPWSQARFTITLEEGRLYVQPPEQDKAELLPLNGGEKFTVEGMPMEVTFMETDTGNIDSYEVSRNGRPGPPFTRVEVLQAQYDEVAKTIRPNGLSDAVLMGDLVAAQALIDAGIDLQELDTRPGIAGNNGRMPLNHAALRNNVDMIDLLLDAGADINAANRSGFAPLHHAAEGDSVEAAQRLIERGADLDLKNIRGMTAADVATVTEHEAVLKILEEARE